jgi:hypothetical protein
MIDSASVSDRVRDVPTENLHVELVLGPGEDRVVVVRSEGELQAQFAQLSRAGWELRRTVEGPDRGDGVLRLSLEFENSRI